MISDLMLDLINSMSGGAGGGPKDHDDDDEEDDYDDGYSTTMSYNSMGNDDDDEGHDSTGVINDKNRSKGKTTKPMLDNKETKKEKKSTSPTPTNKHQQHKEKSKKTTPTKKPTTKSPEDEKKKKGKRIELRLPIDTIPINLFQYVLDNKLRNQKDIIKKLRITRSLPTEKPPSSDDQDGPGCHAGCGGVDAVVGGDASSGGIIAGLLCGFFGGGTTTTSTTSAATASKEEEKKNLEGKHNKTEIINNMRTMNEIRTLFQILPTLPNLKELELLDFGAYKYAKPTLRIKSMSKMTTSTKPKSSPGRVEGDGGKDIQEEKKENSDSTTPDASNEVVVSVEEDDAVELDDDDLDRLLEKEYHTISYMITKLHTSKLEKLTFSLMAKPQKKKKSKSSLQKGEKNNDNDDDIVDDDDKDQADEEMEEDTIPEQILRAMALLPTLRVVTLKCNKSMTLSKLLHFSNSLQELYIVKNNPPPSEGDTAKDAVKEENSDKNNTMEVYTFGDAMPLMSSLQPKLASNSTCSLRILDLGKHIGFTEFSVKLLAGALCNNNTLQGIYFTYNPELLYKNVNFKNNATVADVNNGLLKEFSKVVAQNTTLKLIKNHSYDTVYGISDESLALLDGALSNNVTLKEFMFFSLRQKLNQQEKDGGVASPLLLSCGERIAMLCDAES